MFERIPFLCRLALPVVFLWALSALPSAATHIVGGQLRMKHQTGNTYEFGLMLYFDAVNGSMGALDPSATLAIYQKGTRGRWVDTVRLDLASLQPVAYTDPACQNPSLRTDQLAYVGDITLNPARYTSPTGYYVVWERCCRNHIISNIVQPEAAGQTFYLEFPPLLRAGQRFINSSPEAFAPVRDFACRNVPFRTAFGGTDPDGDSLVYDMVTPLRGNSDPLNNRPVPPLPAPYPRVVWMPGFDSTQQIAGPAPLTINPRTGEIAFTSNQIGLFVFAVRCTEYRAGVRIGEVRREFQELVLDCPANAAPELALTQPGPAGAPVPYVPGTVYQLPDAPADRCLTLYAVDRENNSRLTFQLVAPDAAPGTVLPSLSVGGGTVNPGGRRDTLTARLCFDDCFGRDGAELRLALIVADRACPVPQRDTVWLTVQARAIPDTPPVLTFADAATAGGYTVRPGQQVAFDFVGTDLDPGTRVTVRGIDLATGPLAGARIDCPRRTADRTATTRLTWDVDCAMPPGDYDLHLQTQGEACGRAMVVDTLVRVTVLPLDTSRVLPPNVVTPNADGRNDDFSPAAGLKPACGAEFRRLRIFSRWGREVFSSPDRLATWSADNVAAGLYYYFLEYSDRTYKGWVQVVR